jgi:peptide/nickel transport system ATP-binding protein
MSEVPLVAVDEIAKRYSLPRTSLFRAPDEVAAVDGVSFTLQRARSLGIVGESGSGKSTLARLVMALEVPSGGRIRLLGQDPQALPAAELQRMRRHFQMVFQDPFGALDPRHKVGRIVAEPLQALQPDLGPEDRRHRVEEVMASVGLRVADVDKFPHEFSGGQRQRIAIARALVTRPDLIVADEPVSALDVSVQAQVLNLMRDLEESHGVTYLLISHDLAVVEYVAVEVLVMYLGRIVERAPAETLFREPAHPYTQLLLQSVPRLDGGRRRSAGTRPIAPAPSSVSAGCAFAPRCPLAEGRCFEAAPTVRTLAPDHEARCHLA